MFSLVSRPVTAAASLRLLRTATTIADRDIPGAAALTSLVRPKVTDQGLLFFNACSAGHGSKAWPGAFALAKFLEWNEAQGVAGPLGPLRGRSALELGAGNGVAGLSLARAAACKVTLTDCEPRLFPTLEKNIAWNALEASVRLHRLDWNDEATYLAGESFDLVLGAEAVYQIDCVGTATQHAFTRALAAHLPSGSGTVGLVASAYRGFTMNGALIGFMRSAMADGLHLERLEDPCGRAAGAGEGEPLTAFDGSLFVPIDSGRLQQVAAQADFSESNKDWVQIIRVTRP